MLCDKCCKHMHREISAMEGEMVNLMAYGCDGNGCDYSIRERLDDYYHKIIQQKRAEINKAYYSKQN